MLSVVLPAYNEEAAIEGTLKSLVEILKSQYQGKYEIIVVDDGSIDKTADIAERSGVTVIRKPQNIGYGHSLKCGIEAASFDTIVIIDADSTYPVDQIPKMLKVYGRGFDMVIGARTGKFYKESFIKLNC